jgi:TRAP-type mannitol/chloroaromatic compound transport system permease large subunit
MHNSAQVLVVMAAYMLIVIVCMIMLYTFPQIGLWLPNVLYR